MLPIVRPTRSRLNRMFDNILRGLVVEFRTQHSALRYALGGMLGQSEDFQIYSINGIGAHLIDLLHVSGNDREQRFEN